MEYQGQKVVIGYPSAPPVTVRSNTSTNHTLPSHNSGRQNTTETNQTFTQSDLHSVIVVFVCALGSLVVLFIGLPLIMRATTPALQNPNIILESVFVEPLNFSSSSSDHINSHWNIRFTINNINKYWSVNIYHVTVSLFYKELFFWAEKIDDTSFKLGRHKKTSHEMVIWSSQVPPSIRKAAIEGLAAEEGLSFTVVFNATVSGYSFFNSKTIQMRATCDKVKVVDVSNTGVGSLAGGTKGCFGHN